MTNSIGIIIDGLVAVLLMLTIGYCMLLNRRLKLLKADEQSLRATISELVTATEIAERAIGGLKLTVHECDSSLGERLRKAERVTIEVERSVVAGKELLGRLSQIVTAGRGNDHAGAPAGAAQHVGADPGDAKPAAEQDVARGAHDGSEAKSNTQAIRRTDAKAVAAAAEAFAERVRTKVHGLAA